ncbi:MAG: RpiB/LacA/LacB family sugar-phosphate isomerase, partial [Eubacterium sp.]
MQLKGIGVNMIALGSDHAGFPLKQEIMKHFDEIGVEYKDYGCYSPERFDYAI